jgi:IclR family transcriptional regulator, KDG regulon repressor
MIKKCKELGRHVEAVLRALDLLDCFQRQSALTLNDMAALTGMTRSRVTRLAGTLESRGYLLHDKERALFLLGPRLLTLGKLFEAHNNLISFVRPALKELVKATGEVASLYVIDGDQRVALAREASTHLVSFSVIEGQRMELYAGAGGKVLLAFSPKEVMMRILRIKALKKLTSETIIDLGKLQREMEIIRERGYAVSKGERVPDVWSVSAPVFDHRGLCCAISVTGPIYRLTEGARKRCIKEVVEKARELSERLGTMEVRERRSASHGTRERRE